MNENIINFIGSTFKSRTDRETKSAYFSATLLKISASPLFKIAVLICIVLQQKLLSYKNYQVLLCRRFLCDTCCMVLVSRHEVK